MNDTPNPEVRPLRERQDEAIRLANEVLVAKIPRKEWPFREKILCPLARELMGLGGTIDEYQFVASILVGGLPQWAEEDIWHWLLDAYLTIRFDPRVDYVELYYGMVRNDPLPFPEGVPSYDNNHIVLYGLAWHLSKLHDGGPFELSQSVLSRVFNRPQSIISGFIGYLVRTGILAVVKKDGSLSHKQADGHYVRERHAKRYVLVRDAVAEQAEKAAAVEKKTEKTVKYSQLMAVRTIPSEPLAA
jgi:hypothetical protein